jgi:hypothetical protein
MLDRFSYRRFKKDYIEAGKPLPQILSSHLILWERLSPPASPERERPARLALLAWRAWWRAGSRDLIDLHSNRVKSFCKLAAGKGWSIVYSRGVR